MKVITVNRVRVEPGGRGVTGRTGLHALGAFADGIGLPGAISAALPWEGPGRPGHDRGRLLTQVMLALAGGGDTCSAPEQMLVTPELFGPVASDTTVNRAFAEFTPDRLQELNTAIAGVRQRVWAHLGLLREGERIVLDIDATLIEIHSENKQRTGPTYKRGFGFHPLLCFLAATGEVLAGLLRPGNAGANTITDHEHVLDAAIAQLPEHAQAGHRPGDDPALVETEIVVRTDSAGCSEGFVQACRDRNVRFVISARSNPAIQGAVFDAEGVDVWHQAIGQNGRPIDDGHTLVAELSSLVWDETEPDGHKIRAKKKRGRTPGVLSGGPDKTRDRTDPNGAGVPRIRFIARREPRHPGAQRSLHACFDWRYIGFYTDLDDPDVAGLDRFARRHVHVEQHIERLKDSGLERFPFTRFTSNQAWMAIICLSADMLRWFQLCCLPGPWRAARPKTLRWAILHIAGRITRTARRTIIRIDRRAPAGPIIADTYRRIPILC